MNHRSARRYVVDHRNVHWLDADAIARLRDATHAAHQR